MIETDLEKITELKIEPGTSEETKQEIADEIAALGISECPPEIISYLATLENNSEFYNDSRMIREGVDKVVAYLEFTETQKKELSLAALLHDIGKVFSPAVLKLFSAKKIDKNNTELTVLNAVRDNFPNEVYSMISDLSNVGVKSDMTIRAFWDMHAFWTKEILDKFPVFSKETKIIAASHHIDRGIDPYGIVEGEIFKELKLSIFILMIMDKYQARIRRGGAEHKEAINYLKDGNTDDPVMTRIIETIDELGNSNGGDFFSSR